MWAPVCRASPATQEGSGFAVALLGLSVTTMTGIAAPPLPLTIYRCWRRPAQITVWQA